MANNQATTPKSIAHSKFKDCVVISVGIMLVSFAMFLMKQAHLNIGGTAGLALLVHYVTGWNVGTLYFIANAPFYYLAYRQLGKWMVIKTLITVSAVSALLDFLPQLITITELNPIFIAIFANGLLGVGVLALFRHGSSLGGFNLLGLYFQERFGFAAGKTLLIMDSMVLIASLIKISVWQLLLSILGAVVLNVFIAINHRKDRYIGY